MEDHLPKNKEESEGEVEVKAKLSVCVATYNVLSQNYCKSSEFFRCDPDHIKKSNRLKTIKKILASYIERKAVICLQEVTEEWAGTLTAFFSSNSYTMLTSNYNIKHASGHMGIALAFPNKEFDLQDCRFVRPSRVPKDYRSAAKSDFKDHLPTKKTVKLATGLASLSFASWTAAKLCSKPSSSSSRGFFGLSSSVLGAVAGACGLLGAGITYRAANSRTERGAPNMESKLFGFHNALIMAKLYSRTHKKAFWVATYHMPCRFKDVPVMVALSSLARRKVRSVAKKDPVVFAGDFNMQPDSPPYLAMVEASAPDGFEDMMISGKNLFPLKHKPLTSAYKEANDGKEPSFTNYARRLFFGEEIEFIGTIDYIFISDHWSASNPSEIPDKDKTLKEIGSYPSQDQPSDHILLSVDLTLDS